jgi:hypothetical protein
LNSRSSGGGTSRPVRSLRRHAGLGALLLATLAAAPAGAQEPAPAGPTGFVGLGVAASSMPTGIDMACGMPRYGTAELRAGIGGARYRLESRAVALRAPDGRCYTMDPRARPRPDGMVEQRGSAVAHAERSFSLDARLSRTASTALPWVVAAGAGWLAPQGLPFAVASTGVRTRGRVRLTADFDVYWHRLPYQIRT